jgi:hypothetical protein
MRARARKDSPFTLLAVLAATLVVASVLGLAASRLALVVLGENADEGTMGDERPLSAEGDTVSGLTDVPPVSLVETLPSELSGMEQLVSDDVTTSQEALPVPEAAQDVLMEYQARGNCLLCEAGYLDLQGNVWACVVQGDGWVEVQVVRSIEDGRASELTAIHMDAASWARELNEVLGEEL